MSRRRPDGIRDKNSGRTLEEKNIQRRAQLGLENIPPSGLKEKLLNYRFLLPLSYSLVIIIFIFDIVRWLDFSDYTKNILEALVKISNDGKLYL
jgi:hypothetical protein